MFNSKMMSFSLPTALVVVVITWLTLLGPVSMCGRREAPPEIHPLPPASFYTCNNTLYNSNSTTPVRKLPRPLPNGSERPYVSAYEDGSCPPSTVCLLDYWVDEDNCKRKLNNQPGFQEDHVCVCEGETAFPINGACLEVETETGPSPHRPKQSNHYSINYNRSGRGQLSDCEEALLQLDTYQHLESLTGLGYGGKCDWRTELTFIYFMDELFQKEGRFRVSYLALHQLRQLFPAGNNTTQLCDRSKLLQPWVTSPTETRLTHENCICACTNGSEVRRTQNGTGTIIRSDYCYAYGGHKCSDNYIEHILSDPRVKFFLTPRQLRTSRAHYGLVLPSQEPACGENSCLWEDASGNGKCLPDPHLQSPPLKWFALPHNHTMIDIYTVMTIKDWSYYYLGRDHLDYQYQEGNVTTVEETDVIDEVEKDTVSVPTSFPSEQRDEILEERPFYTCKKYNSSTPVRKLARLLPNGAERPYVTANPDGNCVDPSTMCMMDYWADEDNCKARLYNRPGFREDHVCLCQDFYDHAEQGMFCRRDWKGNKRNHYSLTLGESEPLHFSECEVAVLEMETFGLFESLNVLGYGAKCNWITEAFFLLYTDLVYQMQASSNRVSYFLLYKIKEAFPAGSQVCDRSKLLQPWATKRTGWGKEDCICACTNGTEVRRSQDQNGAILRSDYCYAYGGHKCQHNYIESILSDPKVDLFLTPQQVRTMRAHYGLLLPSEKQRCGENTCLWPDDDDDNASASVGKGKKCLPDPHLQCSPRKWFRLPHNHTMIDMERAWRNVKNDDYMFIAFPHSYMLEMMERRADRMDGKDLGSYIGRDHLDYKYQGNVTVEMELFDDEYDEGDDVGAGKKTVPPNDGPSPPPGYTVPKEYIVGGGIVVVLIMILIFVIRLILVNHFNF